VHAYSLFVWLVADGWCWFVLREKYCWLVAGVWFVLREKYCWLVSDKPNEQGATPSTAEVEDAWRSDGANGDWWVYHALVVYILLGDILKFDIMFASLSRFDTTITTTCGVTLTFGSVKFWKVCKLKVNFRRLVGGLSVDFVVREKYRSLNDFRWLALICYERKYCWLVLIGQTNKTEQTSQTIISSTSESGLSISIYIGRVFSTSRSNYSHIGISQTIGYFCILEVS
jgi:hypothetical protein